MRHRKSGRILGRTSSHRKAMFSNMVTALVTHGRIETTEAKAKEMRSLAERTISIATRVSDLIGKDADKLSAEERARLVHARRQAAKVIRGREALARLFDDLGPAYATRPGGYTRVLKTRNRRGDAAPMAFIELVPQEGLARTKDEQAA
jgi:large subunit ribosomal protein L17